MKHVQRFLTNNPKQTILLLVSLGVCVGLYLYFLNVSVVHVVMRKELLQEQNNLRTEIASLEASYIEAQHRIANRIAQNEGYSNNTPKIFVTRDEASLVLRDR